MLAAVLSLAIGIGANTSIFSVANALLLRPLPYADAERLVILWNRSPGLNITEDWFSTAQYLDIKTGHHGFEQVAIAISGNYNLTGEGDPERVGVIRVSSNSCRCSVSFLPMADCWRLRKIRRAARHRAAHGRDVGSPLRLRRADDWEIRHDQRTAL